MFNDKIAEERIVVSEVGELVTPRIDLQHGAVDRCQSYWSSCERAVEVFCTPWIGLQEKKLCDVTSLGVLHSSRTR